MVEVEHVFKHEKKNRNDKAAAAASVEEGRGQKEKHVYQVIQGQMMSCRQLTELSWARETKV